MTRLGKTSTIAGTANLLLFFLLTGVVTYDQQQLHYFNLAEAQEAIEEEAVEEEEEEVCIDYDSAENTIAINCDASFLDVVQAINDDPEIFEDLGSWDTF